MSHTYVSTLLGKCKSVKECVLKYTFFCFRFQYKKTLKKHVELGRCALRKVRYYWCFFSLKILANSS